MGDDFNLKLSVIIDKLTTSEKNGPEESRLKELKKLCKSSEENVRHSYHLLIHQLQKEHSEIRVNAVIVVNELFTRSHVFRELIVSSFQKFLELTVESDPDQPLPPPLAAAKVLKRKTLGYIQSWNENFGEGYKKLGLGYTFLKQCKQVDFNDINARSVVERQREQIRQQHIQEIDKKKTEEAVSDFNNIRTDVDDCLNQMENCFRLLMPHPDEFFVPQGKDVLEDLFICPSISTENSSKEVEDDLSNNVNERENGLPDRNFSIEINLSKVNSVSPNEDNKEIISNAKDCFKLMNSKYLPKIEKCIKVVTKSGQNSQKLKEFIYVKELIKNSITKYNDLNIPIPSKNCESGSDHEDFEEVPDKEGYEPVIPQHRRKEYGLDPLPSKKPLDKLKSVSTNRRWRLGTHEKTDFVDPTTIAAQPGCSKNLSEFEESIEIIKDSPNGKLSKSTDSKKNEMLDLAPKLRYDMDLYVWEEEKLQPPSVVTYDSLHRFWTPRENEISESVKNSEVASMRQRIIDFSGKFEKVKWSCRAPLPNGKLCPRQDRKKCPFHGLIIPRDELGNPTNEEDLKKLELSAQNQVPEWQDPKLLADIKAETGIDLTISKKGRSKKGKKRKYSNLTDLKLTENTVRNRLEKKVLNSSTMKRVELNMNSEKQQLYNDKFGNQWNYSF